jgi:hypothetical protein
MAPVATGDELYAAKRRKSREVSGDVVTVESIRGLQGNKNDRRLGYVTGWRGIIKMKKPEETSPWLPPVLQSTGEWHSF